MSITDELRQWANDEMPRNYRMAVLAIADRIDAEYKAAVDKAHADGERNGLQQARSASEDWQRGFDEGFASADDWLAEHEDAMAEHGWMRLPVDADGVPIRVGDRLRSKGETCDKVFTTTAIKWNGSRWLISVSDGGSVGYGGFDRLHHVSTIEDVLDEFASAYDRIGGSDEEHQKYLDLIAEYAKRLQLKEVDG